MTRHRPTGKLTKLDPTLELVHLIVDYEDADDFLADFDENLANGRAWIETDRPLAEGTMVQLRMSFPGLLAPLALDGVVRGAEPDGVNAVAVGVRIGAELAGIVKRIRERDPRVVLPVLDVLIVEDNPHVSQLVANGLAASARRDLGHVAFRFTTAEDGGAALDLLRRAKFDAAIVDVYLPVLDGPALIRQVRTSLGLVDLPIITMSAGGDSARAAALNAGATVFLGKPVRLREVVETMRRLIKV